MGGIAKGTRNVGVNVPEEMYEVLKAAADASHMSVSKYVKLLLADSLREGKGYRLQPVNKKEDEMFGHAIAAEPNQPASKKYRKPGKHDPIPKPGKAN